MIAKDSGIGKSFIGLASYLATGKGGQEPERVVWSEGLNLMTDDIKAGACQMRVAAGENTRVDRPVWHFSVNWHPHESAGVTKDLAMAVVRSTLEELGLSEHQAMVVAHDDTEHFHAHVMVNRIHPDTGKSWKQGLSKIALERSMARLSLEHGFEIVPGPHNAKDLGMEAAGPDETTPSEAQRFEDRTGQDSDLTAARELLADAVAAAGSWDDLTRLAAEQGYHVEAAGRGMVFRTKDGSFIKASAVSRDASRPALEARFNETLAAYSDRDAAPATWQTEHDGQRTAEDPQGADRRPQVKPINAADRAKHAIGKSESWLDVDRLLGEQGLSIQAKGRGLVIVDGRSELKASDVGRAFSKSQLENRFDQRFRDHRAETANQSLTVTPEQAGAIDRAVRALQTFETETEKLKNRLATREHAMRSADSTFNLFRAIRADKAAVEKMFQDAYAKPSKARAKFDKLRKKSGYTRAVEQLRKTPSSFGRVKGRKIGLANAERKAALKAIGEGADRIDTYLANVRSMKDASHAIKADLRVRDRWADDPEIARLRDRVGGDTKTNRNQRVQLERTVLDLVKDVDAASLKELPVGRRLRQASIASTVERLRTEQEWRQQGNKRPREPELPITAGPREQAAFEAAKNYSGARDKYIYALYENADKAFPAKEGMVKTLENAANTLANDHPDGIKYLSRFGKNRATLAGDVTTVIQRTRRQDMARRLDKLQSKLRTTGKGVGAVLSLFRRR